MKKYLNTNLLVLVHGSIEAKNCLKEHLKEEISKYDKTYKVKCSEKGMIIPLQENIKKEQVNAYEERF